MYCWKCRQTVDAKDKIHRKDVCSNCGSDLRCCYNCEFYEKEAHHQCKETQSEWVRYKERGNFCDYFRPKSAFFKKPTSSGNVKQDRKERWDSLFKD
jgi:hypothetical protein